MAKTSDPVDFQVAEHRNKGFWKISWRPMQAASAPVHFDAFIEDFSDNWSTNFSPESVYGRMDPIYTFQNTQRRMRLSFAVPAVSVQHGVENLEKFEKLVSFLYPAYEVRGGQRVMSAPPILQLRFGNLVQSADEGSVFGVDDDNDDDPKNGLLVAVNGFSMNPNLELGFFHPYRGQFIPKAFIVECDMGIIHRHALGWNGNKFMGGSYPYNTTGESADEFRPPSGVRLPDPSDYKENKQHLDSQGRQSTAEIEADLGQDQNQSISVAEVEQQSKTARDYEIEQQQQEQIFSDPDDLSNYASFPDNGE